MNQETSNTNPLEIWGAVEYTIARINDSVHDQLSFSGHDERPDDIKLFSDLNIKTIRYPLLWEKCVMDEEKFFIFNDKRLSQLQELNIKPIAGLLHHGSGPLFTSLEDPAFPELFAAYALKIARRYPWIELYTPLNEPLTTARFSGLYGVWYPHKHDDQSFVRILMNELKAIVLAMKAIRTVNKNAKLVLTEDLSRIHSTAELKYQADFENARRWFALDVLTGKFNSEHTLWRYIQKNGISKKEIEYFSDNPTPPDICGFNYYVNSERFLDHRKSIYPSCYHGGNGMHEYADVEAVRANIPECLNLKELLEEAWQRYHLPLALTEVHLACTREEQLRWFYEEYQTALTLKKEGVDIRAVTAWSLLGSFDWNSLLVKKNRDYESGVYDIRSGSPRPTALAGMIKSINKFPEYSNSLLRVPGWWRRRNRFIFKDENEKTIIQNNNLPDTDKISPLLIIGATGSLGSAFARICEMRGIVYFLSNRNDLDIASEESVRNLLDEKKPWGVVNAAGFSRIDAAEKASLLCWRENIKGPVNLARICHEEKIKFVTFSTDQVFNGRKRKPYTDSDRTEPLNYYGLSKRLAEEKVTHLNPEALIIRSGLFFNPWHKEDGLSKILKSGMASDMSHFLANDIIISPTYIPDLVNTVLDLLIDGESGIWHLSNQEEVSYYDFVRLALNLAGMSDQVIKGVDSSKLKLKAERPSYSVLKSSFGIILPLLGNSLQNYLNEFFSEPSLQILNQPSI